jgi:hypothetical protein
MVTDEIFMLGSGGKPEENSPLGRPKRRWEDNLKMNHIEEERYGVDLICLRIMTCGQVSDRGIEAPDSL